VGHETPPKILVGGAPAEIEFGVFEPKNLTAGGNNFYNFADNQLTKFHAVFHPAGCFRWA